MKLIQKFEKELIFIGLDKPLNGNKTNVSQLFKDSNNKINYFSFSAKNFYSIFKKSLFEHFKIEKKKKAI